MTTTGTNDPGRRVWLIVTVVTVGVGLIAAVVPFVASMAPSERAPATGAPVGVDLQAMKEGELKTVEWRGQPLFVPLLTLVGSLAAPRLWTGAIRGARAQMPQTRRTHRMNPSIVNTRSCE